LRFRYSSGKDGTPVKKATVYTQDEHGIKVDNVDTDAVYITSRLNTAGYETYIVGGAVRDLILGKKPKDFDIASAASPAQLKKIFRNARVIGKRFRLVHVFFGSKIIEVATFRSVKEGSTGNEFGTIEEDVLRRDFSINALFYDPGKQIVVDYIGGMRDIWDKKIRPIIPLKVIFTDDPVRMIRAVKYAALAGFDLPLKIRWKIKTQAALLAHISPSRLTEEITKILHSPDSAIIVRELEELGLYEHLQPEASKLMKSDTGFRRRYLDRFAAIAAASPPSPAVSLQALYRDKLEESIDWKEATVETYKNIFYIARQFVLPMNPPRIELDRGIRMIFAEHNIIIKKSCLVSERGGHGNSPRRRGRKEPHS
jgi:poly(A) polymerase